ncbi:hypothetical protein OAX78_01510 [Planctomycetota bacterium]|nr:hypothetical protein [Planctomycetota bacterium]
MSDGRLRELERQWKESGSVEDEAAFLVERVRVGKITEEKLTLAAYLDHEPAQVALGLGRDARDPLPAHRERLAKILAGVPRVRHEWLLGLVESCQVAALRGAVRVIRDALGAECSGHDHPKTRQWVDLVEDMLVCPCDEHLERVRAAYGTGVPWPVPLSYGEFGCRMLHSAAGKLLEALTSGRPEDAIYAVNRGAS